MKKLVVLVALVAAMAAKADYWMTFCKTPGGQQYSQLGYVNPDADGFVTIKAGPLTVVVYKTQVWYQKMPGDDGKMVEVKESTGQYLDACEMIAEGGMV